MVGTVVLAHDAKRNKWIYAHQRCAREPRYRTVRELNSIQEFGDRDCGVCARRLNGTEPETTPAAPTQRPLKDTITLIRNRATGELFYACTLCAGKVTYPLAFVRTFRNCGVVSCSFCGVKIES